MIDPVSDHEAKAERRLDSADIGCAVLTVSDSRTAETDRSGNRIAELLGAGGYLVLQRSLVSDDPDRIDQQLRAWIGDAAVHAIVITGGTGLGRRDNTVDVVRPLIDIELEGFGELFRMLSYQQVKAAAMLSRAMAGLAAPAYGTETFIFALPGSTSAVELACEELIVPQLKHLVFVRSDGATKRRSDKGLG